MKLEHGISVQLAGLSGEMIGYLVPNSYFCPSLECPVVLEELDNNIS
jgi:hypothetical protein